MLVAVGRVVEVRRAALDDWEAVRATRLRALADAPYAFASTLAREAAFDSREWRRMVGGGDWFLAWVGDQPIGIAAGVADDHLPEERHLVAMWVSAAHRGSTAATQLVEAVCDWARAQGAGAVTLWVADGNLRARRFYERLGFRSTGRRQPLPSAPEVGEEQLRRELAHLL
jgi:RimJ/RimL family protein N-acetyltransferase